MESQSFPQTLVDAIRYFADPNICVQFMASLRWPNGVECPTCGSKEVSYLSTRRMWKCKTEHKKQQFSVKNGTVLEDSPIPLDRWLAAMWMMCNDKNGISSYEVAKAIGITQKSAWFLMHRIRLSMQSGDFKKFFGECEADETFIGGKARNMHGDVKKRRITGTGGKDKTAVMGILQRGGKVRATVIPNRKKKALQAEVRKHVEAGSALYTDALLSYEGLEGEYAHQVIDHAVKYVDGQIHTNGLENFWSLLKRSISGTYVSVEPFHLFRYLDEQTFRYNHRSTRENPMSDADRFRLACSQVIGKRLTYNDVTGKTMARELEPF
jgi:transposase-like protein